MRTSSYFERTFFYDQSPATEEFFLRESAKLFEVEAAQSRIKALVFDPKSGQSNEHNANVHLDGDSDSSCSPEAAVDQHSPRQLGPPIYVAKSRLIRHEIAGEIELEKLIKRTKNDFRIFLLHQRHSFSRLQVNKILYDTLVKHCHVFPRFNEYILNFGVKSKEQEVGPPRFKCRPLSPVHGEKLHGFECAYILRFVEFTNRGGGKEPWSLRQIAIYNRYKPQGKNGCSTWILVGASERVEIRLDRYTRSTQNPAELNPLEIHLILLDTALANWRPYMVDLTQRVRDLSDKVLVSSVEDDENVEIISYEDRQKLKKIEDQVIDILLILDSTLDTTLSLLERYTHFSKPLQLAEQKRIAYGTDPIIFALNEKSQEITYARKKAKALASKIQSTMKLLSTSLDYQSGHHLKALTEKGTNDSSAVKVLAMITLIYLPSTVVSNFYSTQFVKQESSGQSTKVSYSGDAWLFFAISIPLTLITISTWLFWAILTARISLFKTWKDQTWGDLKQGFKHCSRLGSLRRSADSPISKGMV